MLGAEQVALGIELFQIAGVTGLVAVFGKAQRALQHFRAFAGVGQLGLQPALAQQGVFHLTQGLGHHGAIGVGGLIALGRGHIKLALQAPAGKQRRQNAAAQ